MALSAEFYTRWFDSLHRDERGDKVIQEELDELLSSLYSHSMRIERVCPESYDSSLLFYLKGGETVCVHNPDQCAFSAFIL